MEHQHKARLTKSNSTSDNNLQAKTAPQKPIAVHPVLQLQRKIGNQAVQRLLSSGGIQAKLKISQPGDKYEQEADKVANQVMRMPDPPIQRQTTKEDEEEKVIQGKFLSDDISPLVQRRSEAEEKNEIQRELVSPVHLNLQRQEELEEEEEEPIQPQLLQRQEEEEDEPKQSELLQRQESEEHEEEELVAQSKVDQNTPVVQLLNRSTVQTKLTNGKAGDKYEQEADRVAEQVMRMPEPLSKNERAVSGRAQPLQIQRVCSECEPVDDKEEMVQAEVETDFSYDVLRQKKEEEDELTEAKLQPKGSPRQERVVSSAITADVHALKNGGSPLPQATRGLFEPRFGADFSQVRVHTDARAADTAKSINAKAFTVGRDIAFGAGQYAPESPGGQRLLAHELTHVVQQHGEHVQRDKDDAKPPPQTATAQPPPDPETLLIEDLANHLLQMPDVIDALELSKGTAKRLTTTVEKMKIDDDEDLKQRLAALDKKKRGKVAAAALAQVQSVLGERRAERLDELAGEIVTRTKDRFVALAEVARKAELEEDEQLKLDPKRKGKRRPQFGGIRKYILKDTIERQIDKPQTKPYTLRADYATPLGLAKDEVLFPDLHGADFVAELKGLPRSMRQPLKDEVDKRTLEVLADYIQERMGTVPKAILDEWSKEYGQLDEERVRNNIEGRLSGYFAVRMEFFTVFGSPADVPATIKAINNYFVNELVECEFLKDAGVKGAGNTLVHKNLNTALKKAEDFMNDPKRKWRDEVITSVKPLGYWATNIRENRNNPARPSEHTYGFALDINADLNPNLAKFKPADWDFISAMAGERAIYEQGGAYTEGAKALRDPSASTEAKMLDAMKKIRAQSAALVATFASDSSLRARLRQIVSASPAGKGKTPAEVDALLDLARHATTGLAKDRQKDAKSLQTTLEADIFKQEPIASEPVGTASKLRDKLVKLLAPNLRQPVKVTDAEAAIRGQIVAPVEKATADAKKHKVGALFTKSIVKELNAVGGTDRAELARQVLRDLREPLIRKETEAKARALAGLLKRGFEVFDQTKDKTGTKVGPGAGMPNIAVHGFSNLNEKLVVALVHPEGGNLRWLGVHNQDMHHFELRTPPSIPKATITAPVPQPSTPPPPPAVAPQPPGLINPWPEL